MTYKEYLNTLYRRASAARRKQLRKNPQPCEVCGYTHTSVSVDGIWLCDEHMKILKQLQPMKSVAQKLDSLGIAYATELEFNNGQYKLKKVNINYKVPWKVSYRTEEYDYNGTGKVVKK